MLFTAYAIVRTVPSANRPNRRKKKPFDLLPLEKLLAVFLHRRFAVLACRLLLLQVQVAALVHMSIAQQLLLSWLSLVQRPLVLGWQKWH